MYRDFEPRRNGGITRRAFVVGGVAVVGSLIAKGLGLDRVFLGTSKQPTPPATDIIIPDIEEQKKIEIAQELLDQFKGLLSQYVNPSLYDLKEFGQREPRDLAVYLQRTFQVIGTKFQVLRPKAEFTLKRQLPFQTDQERNYGVPIYRDSVSASVVFELPIEGTNYDINSFDLRLKNFGERAIPDLNKLIPQGYTQDIPRANLIPVARIALRNLPQEGLAWNVVQEIPERSVVSGLGTSFEDQQGRNIKVKALSNGTILFTGVKKTELSTATLPSPRQ